MSTGWNAEKFELYAEVELEAGDKRTLEVLRFSARFPLNDVPRGSMTVSLGRRVDSNAPSEIHKILSRLKVKRKVDVWCKAKTLGVFGLLGINLWPKDKFKVFEGYTTGAGYQRTSTSAEYTLELEHWVADLGYASATSALSSPQNPGQMTFAALTANASESAGGTANAGGMTGLTRAEEFINAGTIGSDFWGDALHKFLLSLAGEETLVDSVDAGRLGLDLAPLAAGNEPAKKALERFEPKEPVEFSKKLSFEKGAYGDDLEAVADQIEIALGHETLEVLAGSTLWDKLVQYANTFMFAVVPMVERVLVVPFLPGLRKEYVTVSAKDYEFVRISGDMPRVLRGVGIYGGKGFEGGSEMTGDDAVNYDQFAIGGYYQGAKTGQILFKQAPMWMATVNLSSEVDKACGADGVPVADVTNVGEGKPPEKAKPKEKAEANARLMNEYAKAMYVYEVLKFRGGDMSGKLRFDVGPGSVLKIEGCGEKFLGVDDQFGQTMFATVLQVDIFLDAEGSRAGTSFHLAHWRNELENETDGFSLKKHPLWSTEWSGAPLQKLDTLL